MAKRIVAIRLEIDTDVLRELYESRSMGDETLITQVEREVQAVIAGYYVNAVGLGSAIRVL